MTKSSLVRSCQTLVTKRLFTAMLASVVAAGFATSTFAQEGESKEDTTTSKAEVQVEVPAPPETPAAPEAPAVSEVKAVEGQPAQEPQVVEGIEISAEKVAVSEAALGKYWLGLGLKKVEGDLATYLGNDKGMFIFEIYPDSPASKADWKVGDILLSFNGKEVNDFEVLLSEISAVETKTAKCELLRKGEKVEEEITAEVRPAEVPQIEADAKATASWTFEALPENMIADADGVKTMILRAVPGSDVFTHNGQSHVFMVEGGELKLPEEALKAIPELSGAMKSLKNIEVTKIGKGMTVTVAGQEKEGENTTTENKNISVSVIRKSGDEAGSYTVTIDGEKFEGSLDKIKEAPEKVQKALEKVHANIGSKTVKLENGVTMTLSPTLIGEKSQKEVEIILKKAEEAAKKVEGTATATIVVDGKELKPENVKKNVQVIVKGHADKEAEGKKGETKTESTIKTESRIVIASTDEDGKVKVVELDGGNLNGSLGGANALMLGHELPEEIKAKLPEEIKAKIAEAKKKAEASGKKAAIAIGNAKEVEGKKMELRLHAVGADKGEALKKEIEELRAIINDLKKQIEEMKK